MNVGDFMDEYKDSVEDMDSYFKFVDDGMSDDERKKFVDGVIGSKNEYLKSIGYEIDGDGKISLPDTMMEDGIIGFAVADALGVPVEFYSRSRLDKHPCKDMIGFGSHLVPEGTWSDDTSMMLATMDSIIDNGLINCDDVMNKFYMWLEYAKYTALNTNFDIGITTKKSILNYKTGIDPLLCGGKDIRDNGNGSLMRMLPVAYYLNENNLDEEQEVQMVNSVSSLTHAHEISCLGCKIYCDYVKQLLNGVDKKYALSHVCKNDYSKYYSDDAVNKYSRILKGDIIELSRDDIKSTGYVVDTLEASLWSFLNTDSFEEAVISAVNLGGDTDTIGAITGSMAGIVYGKKEIPSRWLVKLKRKEYIEEISNNFVDVIKSNNKDRKR